MRLDQYLAQEQPEYSRSVWQKYIHLGCVTVDNVQQTDSNYTVADDAIVKVTLPEKSDFSNQTLPVLYEDDNVIVINKPIGVLAHAKGELNDEFTVADFFRPKTTFGLETNRPGIIHRLDRDTSGVMIGAKNPETAKLLAKQFQDRRAKKVYTAVLSGTPKELRANLDLPIGRNPKNPSTFRVDVQGKSARTYYEILETSPAYSLATLRPTTGRTHQLRVHMAYLGTPILGDRVYGKPAERLYLHAAALEITIPEGDRRTFEAPVPKEFEDKVTS